MLKLYFYQINEQELTEKRERAMSLLPSWRVEKVERMKLAGGKRLELAAGLLLRQAVLELTGREIREMEVSFGEQGKPCFGNREGEEGIFFNLSHSGISVAAAVADMPVGVDVEEKTDPGHGVAEHVFSPEELVWMREQPDPKRAFTFLWTRKEAFVKCTGTGITVPLDRFSVLHDRPVDLREAGERKEGEESWAGYRIHTLRSGGDYALSCCVNPQGEKEKKLEGFPEFTLDIVQSFDI